MIKLFYLIYLFTLIYLSIIIPQLNNLYTKKKTYQLWLSNKQILLIAIKCFV